MTTHGEPLDCCRRCGRHVSMHQRARPVLLWRRERRSFLSSGASRPGIVATLLIILALLVTVLSWLEARHPLPAASLCGSDQPSCPGTVWSR